MCQKCVCGRGSALDPAGRALYAPQTASWIWGKQRGYEERERQRMEGEERAGEGKDP